MSPKTKRPKSPQKEPGQAGTLEVSVQRSRGLEPATITLTNGIHAVRWRCEGLAKGARLQIHFLEDARGPFIGMGEDDGSASHFVIAGGNRGPEDSLGEYSYEARILRSNGEMKVLGAGSVINQATRRVLSLTPMGLGEPPVEPP